MVVVLKMSFVVFSHYLTVRVYQQSAVVKVIIQKLSESKNYMRFCLTRHLLNTMDIVALSHILSHFSEFFRRPLFLCNDVSVQKASRRRP